MSVTKCYAPLESLVEDAAKAAIAAEMLDLGFDGSTETGFTGWTTLWKDTGLPQEEVHISYPDGRVTLTSNPGQDITPPPDDLRFDPVEVFQRWPEWLDLLFYPWYSRPQASDFEGKVGVAQEVVERLAPAGTSIDGTGAEVQVESGRADLAIFVGEIDDKATLLSGTAMETLKTSYLSRLPIVIGGQFALASVIGIGIAGEQELWRQVDADISEIAIKAKEAFDAHVHGGSFSAYEFFQAAGVVAGVAAIFATGGIAATAGVLGSAAGIATTYIVDEPTEPEPPEFAGGSPQAIYDNVRNAITALGDEAMSGTEDAFRNAMDRAARMATGDDSVDNFSFGRPTDFLHETDRGDLFGGGQGLAVSKDAMLFIAGRLQFVAQHMTGVLATLDGVLGPSPWHRAGTMGIGPEGHYFAWSQLVGELATSLDQARKSLHALAGRMVLVARDFQATEDQVAAELAQLVKDLPDPTPVGG